MSRQGRLLAVGVCLALTGGPAASARARKPPAHVVLDYRRLAGAEVCPTRPQLEAQVREILGRPPFAKRAPRTVRCVLQGGGGGVAARVELRDSGSARVLGVRELSGTGPGCQELGGAVALAIALAIDPLARPPRPPPAATVTATPPVAPPSGAGPQPTPSSGAGAAGASAADAGAAGASAAGTSAAGAGAVGVGAAGASAAGTSAAGAGASGTSAPPRTGPPTRGSLAPDAGPLSPLALTPLVLARAPDAGRPQPPDAGRPPPPDAGPVPVVAGTPVRDAGASPADAGLGAPDAGPSPTDAGMLPADAGPPDAGPELPATEAGVPLLAAVPTPPKEGWRPVVGVEAIGAAGVLPGFAAGVLVHAGAASSTASIELEGRWLPGTHQPFGTGSVSTSLVSGALVGCARFGSWGGCGLALAGPVKAQGEGYSRSQEASAWMVSAGARAQWEWLFADPIGLRLHVDGAVNLVRPRFLVDSQEAWAVPPLCVWVGGGLFGRF